MSRLSKTNGSMHPYSTSNTSKGALVSEATRVFEALAGGRTVGEVRQAALDGTLFGKRTRENRARVWDLLYGRYLSNQHEWVLADLRRACDRGSQGAEFVSLLYLHFALRDRLTFDFVVTVLWPRWQSRETEVSPNDVLFLLDQAAAEQPQVGGWSASSRLKLAQSTLAALRDFGVLEGRMRKRIVRPELPLPTVEHVVRLLAGEGARGSEVLRDERWQLFLRSEDEIAGLLTRLSQEGRIRFERSGLSVVLETPEGWRTT